MLLNFLLYDCFKRINIYLFIYLDTDGVGHILADHRALLSGDRGALGHGDTVGDSNTCNKMLGKLKIF